MHDPILYPQFPNPLSLHLSSQAKPAHMQKYAFDIVFQGTIINNNETDIRHSQPPYCHADNPNCEFQHTTFFFHLRLPPLSSNHLKEHFDCIQPPQQIHSYQNSKDNTFQELHGNKHCFQKRDDIRYSLMGKLLWEHLPLHNQLYKSVILNQLLLPKPHLQT